MRRIPIAAFLLLAPLAQAAPDAPEFSLLKITQGEKVTFKALPSQEVAAERKRISAESSREMAAWSRKAEDFAKNRSNKGKPLPALEPLPTSTIVEKASIPSEEAALKLAEEKQKKTDEIYVLVQVQGIDGKKTSETLPKGQLRAREESLYSDYLKAWEDYAKETSSEIPAPIVVGACAEMMPPAADPAPMKPKITRLQTEIAGKDEAERILKTQQRK